MSDFFTANISDVDPMVSEAIDDEVRRQTNGLELIASENFVSEAVLQAMGTQDIERRSAYSRTGALNHLLRVSFPTEQDTVEQFSKAVKKAARRN